MSIHINHRNNSITTGSNAETPGITITINNTGSIVVPKGTTAQRPATPVAGMFRYNTNTNSLEYYNGTSWTTVFAGSVEDLTGSSGELIVDGVSVGATAANYVRITNANTGQDPRVEAAGTDTNIDLQINSKGTGVVSINSALNVSPATNNYQLNIVTESNGVSQTVTNGGDLFLKGRNVVARVSGAGGRFSVVNESNNDIFNVVSSGNTSLTIESGNSDTKIITSAGSLALMATTGTGVVKIGNGTNEGLVVKAATPGPQLEVTTGGGTTTLYTSGQLIFNSDQPTINFSLKRLINVDDPVNDTDVANKRYVDSVAAGLDWKQSVRAATTTNITLSGEITVDGVALVSGNRVLVKNQTSAQFNGIYEVRTGSWVRASDADSNSEVTAGMAVFVEEGTVNKDTGWVLITDNPINLGTTELQFTQFTGAASLILDGESGIITQLSGSVWDIRADVDNLTIWASAPNGSGKKLAVYAPDSINQYSVLIAPASAGPDGRSAVWGKVQLDSDNAVNGTLQVNRGGTGLNSIPQHSILVTQDTANNLVAISTGGNENRFLMYDASTSAFAFVSAGVVGGQYSFGKIALSGNFTGSSVVSAGAPGDTLTLVGGNAINLIGSAAGTGITINFANVNMSSVPVTYDDKVVFFDTSNTDKPEHRTFKGVFNDLNVPHNLTALGFAVQVSANEWVSRSIVASTSSDRVGIEIVNGNGVGGNPTVGLNIEGLTQATTFSADSTYLVAYRGSDDTNVRISVEDVINKVDKTRIHDSSNTTYIDVDEISGRPVIYSVGQRVAVFEGLSTAASASRFFNFNVGSSADSIRIEASGTTTDINIRLVPKGTGSVIVGDTTDDGVIQADPGRNLILRGGDGGGNVEIVPGSAGGQVIIRNDASAKLVTFGNNFIRHHSLDNDSYKDEYVIRLTVSTSGGSDSYEIPLETSSVMMLEGHVVGFGPNPNGIIGYKVESVLYRLGSNAGIVDSTVHTIIAASGHVMSVDITTSGTNAKFTVTSDSPASFTAFLRSTVVIKGQLL